MTTQSLDDLFASYEDTAVKAAATDQEPTLQVRVARLAAEVAIAKREAAIARQEKAELIERGEWIDDEEIDDIL
jgi:hypothetical protein